MKASTLFVTCLADTFYPGAAEALRRVMGKLGFDMACPLDQTCCGQPFFNAGYFDRARKVATRFLRAFEKTQGPIVAPSSSCAAMVREHYPALFEAQPELHARALAIGKRTFEFSEFLVNELRVDLSRYGARFEGSVTFHYSCHYRALGVTTEPIDLIKQIGGLEYIPLENLESCCGFGGTFSLNFPHVSREMVADKVRAIKDTGAEGLIFADPGCALNITGYAHRIGVPLKAIHLAELIDRALGGNQ